MTRKLIDPKTIDVFLVNPSKCGGIWEALSVHGVRRQLTEVQFGYYAHHINTSNGASVWKLKPEYEEFIKYLHSHGRSVSEVVAEYLRR